ncbi:MAG TPA: radical SAM protein [Oligoflexia bacterium]|nr:radical SAM protein [Oligoflexia bacterium]
MKVTLVQPPALVAVDNYSTITLPPLGIAYIAGYLRSHHHEVTVVDAVGAAVRKLEPWPKRKKRLIQGLSFEEILERIPSDTQVIGVTCMFTHAWPMVRDLLAALKERFPKAWLVCGGEHITSMHPTVLEQTPVDFCVLGEGEYTFRELIDLLGAGNLEQARTIQGVAYKSQAGQVVKNERRPRIKEVDNIPWPAWDLMDPMAYNEAEIYQGPQSNGKTIPMLATRGCPYRCTFCSSPNMWTQLWKPRDPIDVVNEIESYMKKYGAADFQFQDLTAIVKRDWILTFCKEILRRELKITWTLPAGTRSEVVDDECASYLMRSGCQHITFAPESGSPRILDRIQKRVDLNSLEDSAKACLRNGMKVCLFIIVGFPFEEKSDIRATFKWLRHMARIGVHEVATATFVPLPGTQLFGETSAISKIEVDDEYCHWMTAATSMLTVRSWNPRFSDRQILFYKLYAMAQFYAVSYFFYPSRAFRLIRNFILHKQETKVDRVLREMVNKTAIVLKTKLLSKKAS